jgi:TP901 family phage tail tape measure protein
VFIEFLGKSTGFMATARGVKAELASVDKEGGGSMAKMGAVSKAALLGIGVAAGVAAVKSVKMAADFQSSMLSLNTQAGVSKDKISGLSTGVLNLAGQVGFAPDSLAQALYHIESSFASVGITGPRALELLKVSAEGAAVGHADLVDVTNALDAAVASGIPGVQNLSQAMGALNAIVGSGDMEMQDLADALGTGVLAVVKGYGLSLSDVGAALATFGDNNIRGAAAATDLRMAVQALAVPAAAGKKALAGMGFSMTSLQKDMQKGGLKLALNDLMEHMRKTGITAKTQGAVITQIFGKKAGSGLAVLLGQLDRVNSKYPELAKGANGFGNAWQSTSQSFNQRVKELQAGFQALAIKIGTVLLPYATKFIGWLSQGATLITSHRTAVIALGAAIGGILTIGLAAAAVAAWNFTAAILANPVTWIVVGVMALVAGLVMLITHWKQVWGWIKTDIPGVANFFKATWRLAMSAVNAVWSATMTAIHAVAKWFNDNVIKWLDARMKDFQGWWKGHATELSQVWQLLWKEVQLAAGVVWDFLKVGITALTTVFRVGWDIISGVVKTAWALISGAVTTGYHFVLNIFGVLIDALTGHWSKAWSDIKHLLSQAFSDIVNTIKSSVSNFGSMLYSAGKDLIQGLINGVKNMASAAWDAVKSVGSGLKHAAMSILGIKSPSRVFRDEVGKWIPLGLAEGITANAPAAHAAMADTANGLVDSFSSTLGIASPSKVFRQLGLWVNQGLVDGMTGSLPKVKSAVKKTESELISAKNRLQDMLGTKSARGYNGWIRQHEAAISRLEKSVSREGTQLERMANKRLTIAAKLKDAQKQLATLQKDWTKERDSVASNIMQGASVVMQQSTSGAALTAGDVVANMQDQVSAAMHFADELHALQKRGLSADLINQIAAAGVDQGGTTAQALMSANSDQLKQLNGMQGQMKNAANSVGGAVADSMYGTGINAAKGLIKGLQSQEKAIDKQMLRIAKSMETQIKKALGIHSPSRLFHEIGQFVTSGLVNGIDAGNNDVRNAASRMADAVVRGSDIPALSGSAAGGAVVQHNVHIEVHGSVRSDRDLRDVVIQEMQRYGGRNSVTYAQAKR